MNFYRSLTVLVPVLAFIQCFSLGLPTCRQMTMKILGLETLVDKVDKMESVLDKVLAQYRAIETKLEKFKSLSSPLFKL